MCPRRWGRARHRRGGADVGKQVRGTFDLAHRGLIGVGGSTGEVPDSGRWRSSSGASAPTRIPAKCGGRLSHVWVWELRWRLGRSAELSVDHGHERSTVLTGGGNGGRRRTVSTCGRTQEERRGVYRRSCMQRQFCPALAVYRSHGMGEGCWSRGGRRQPMVASTCGRRRVRTRRVAPAYGQVRVTTLRHTVPTEPALGLPGRRGVSACVRVRTTAEADAAWRGVARRARSGAQPFQVPLFDSVFLQILQLNFQECQLVKL
jgi:hypothetical protein